MFRLLKRTKRTAGLTGIHVGREGTGLAEISWSGTDPKPNLVRCEFHPGEDPGALLRTLAQYRDAPACNSLLDNHKYNLLLVEAPEVAPAELRAAARWRIKGLIDYPVDSAVLDVFEIEGQRGRVKMMYVVVAAATDVQSHIHLLEGTGIHLRSIDIYELALRNIAALLSEDAAGVALLHLTPEGGLLTLTQNGNLFLARNLELGTNALGAELTAHPGELSDDLRGMLDSVILEIQRTLDYYESHFGMPPISGLVIAPLAMSMSIPDFAGYLGGNLGLPVRMLDLNAVLTCDTPLTDELQAQCLLAIGAALRVEGEMR